MNRWRSRKPIEGCRTKEEEEEEEEEEGEEGEEGEEEEEEKEEEEEMFWMRRITTMDCCKFCTNLT